MVNKRIAIRADGSTEIGMGHIVRCLALAKVFSSKGWDVSFFTRNDQPAVKLIRASGFKIFTIPPDLSGRNLYQVIIRNLTIFHPEVIINDVLDTEKGYMQEIRKIVRLIINFDDTGEASLLSDGVINTFRHRDWRKKIKAERPQIWQGVKYLILRDEFRRWRKREKVIVPQARKIIVIMGGSDTHGYSLKLLKILKPMSSTMQFNLIIGPAFSFWRELHEMKRQINFQISFCPKHMAYLFYSHDLAICSGGITLYEMTAVGTPALALANEEHELFNIQRLSRCGAVIGLGHGSRLKGEIILRRLKSLSLDYKQRKTMSVAGKSYVDAEGLKRVVDIITNLLYGISNCRGDISAVGGSAYGMT